MHLSVVLDCCDPAVVAAFWQAALGYDEVANDGTYIALRDPERKEPTLVLQRVPEPKSGKNRMHLDVFSTDFDSDRDRLLGLGATTLTATHVEAGDDSMQLTVLADPEGNEFCLLAPLEP